jgi:hypothetical protein
MLLLAFYVMGLQYSVEIAPKTSLLLIYLSKTAFVYSSYTTNASYLLFVLL